MLTFVMLGQSGSLFTHRSKELSPGSGRISYEGLTGISFFESLSSLEIKKREERAWAALTVKNFAQMKFEDFLIMEGVIHH